MTTLELYRAAIAGDDAFEAALRSQGLDRWTNWQGNPVVERAYHVKRVADAELHEVYARLNDIRRAAHCVE